MSGTTGIAPWYSGAERAVQKAFNRIVQPGHIVFDLGANWGLHSLYLSSLVGPAGRVIALEPYAPVYEELLWHLQTNGANNVVALPIAASRQDGETTFMIGGNATTGHVAPGSHPLLSTMPSIKVTTQKIDTLVAEMHLPRVDFLKLDIEGGEGEALLGAEETVHAFAPSFIIELHSPEQDRLVADWLLARHYGLYRLSGAPITRVDLTWPEPEGVWGTIVAHPQ